MHGAVVAAHDGAFAVEGLGVVQDVRVHLARVVARVDLGQRVRAVAADVVGVGRVAHDAAGVVATLGGVHLAVVAAEADRAVGLTRDAARAGLVPAGRHDAAPVGVARVTRLGGVAVDAARDGGVAAGRTRDAADVVEALDVARVRAVGDGDGGLLTRTRGDTRVARGGAGVVDLHVRAVRAHDAAHAHAAAVGEVGVHGERGAVDGMLDGLVGLVGHVRARLDGARVRASGDVARRVAGDAADERRLGRDGLAETVLAALARRVDADGAVVAVVVEVCGCLRGVVDGVSDVDGVGARLAYDAAHGRHDDRVGLAGGRVVGGVRGRVDGNRSREDARAHRLARRAGHAADVLGDDGAVLAARVAVVAIVPGDGYGRAARDVVDGAGGVADCGAHVLDGGIGFGGVHGDGAGVLEREVLDGARV